MTFFTALCAAVSCGCMLYFVIDLLGSADYSVNKEKDASAPLPLLFRMVLPALKYFLPLVKSEKLAAWRENSEAKLDMAGYGNRLTGAEFLALRVIFLLIGLFFLLFGVMTGKTFLCLLLAVLLAFYPTLWLSGIIKKRHLSIMKALPNVLDLLTLSVEAGRDLLSSLRDILSRRKMDPLGEELLRTFHEIQLGRNRSEALRAMAKRVRQPDLTATVNAIVQSEELGVSIANALRIQGDMQRNKRFALAEKMANEAAVKIIFPVVFFILPAVFIILLGPIVTQAIKMFR